MPPGQIRPPSRTRQPGQGGMRQQRVRPTVPPKPEGGGRNARITELLGKIRARRGGGKDPAAAAIAAARGGKTY